MLRTIHRKIERSPVMKNVSAPSSTVNKLKCKKSIVNSVNSIEHSDITEINLHVRECVKFMINATKLGKIEEKSKCADYTCSLFLCSVIMNIVVECLSFTLISDSD